MRQHRERIQTASETQRRRGTEKAPQKICYVRRFLCASASVCFLTMFHVVGAWAQSTEPNPGLDRPVTTQELDQLKRKIADDTRSNIEGIFEYHTETGDLNNRLDFYRAGARLNLKLTPATLLQIRGTHTPYSTENGFLTERGTNLTLGIRSQITEGTSLDLEAGGTSFTTDGRTINALAAFGVSPGNLKLRFTGSRSNVEESLLSTAGLRPVTGPFAGTLVGLVMDNRFVADGSYQLLQNADVFASGGIGAREGSNVELNWFQTVGGGGGYNFIARADDEPLRLVRASYTANYVRFDKDLSGFGGASLVDRQNRVVPLSRLGTDLISPDAAPGRAGVGGYFSPRNNFNHVIRGDIGGRFNPNVEYQVAGFIGSQYYTGSPRRSVNGFSGTVTFWLTDRYSFPVTFVRDNFGPYTQQSLFAQLIARF